MPIEENTLITKILVVLTGFLGFVLSWSFFIQWGIQYDFAFLQFWENALLYSQAKGLVWDLVACGGIVTILTIKRSAELGWARVTLILCGTWIAGVCVGLPLFFLLNGSGSLSSKEGVDVGAHL